MVLLEPKTLISISFKLPKPYSGYEYGELIVALKHSKKGGYSAVTHNQIDYWKYKEEERHNLATEEDTDIQNRETNRHNVATENFNLMNLAEGKRHNLATEVELNRHNIQTEQETNRHNVSTEQLGRDELNEAVRHNKSTESIGYATLAETKRSNLAREVLTSNANAESMRHNTQMENQASASLRETKRSNKANEANQYYSTTMKHYDTGQTNRYNLLGKTLQSLQNLGGLFRR